MASAAVIDARRVGVLTALISVVVLACAAPDSSESKPTVAGTPVSPATAGETFTESESGSSSTAEGAPEGSQPQVSEPTWIDLMVLDFEAGPPFVNSGVAPSEVRVRGSSDLVELEAGPGGEGLAARFPPFDDGTGDGSKRVITVEALEAGGFDLGLGDFRLGADVSVDSLSVGSSSDNGNNVVQRGLFSDPSQIKIQIDDGSVSCRIKGSEGSVFVKDAVPLDVATWYRIACMRLGDRISLTVADVLSGEPPRRIDRVGPTGNLLWDDAPLSVGGKVDEDGRPVASNFDQFNGSIDNVRLSIAVDW